MKRLYFMIVLLVNVTCFTKAQDISQAQQADPIVWFGFDFTMAKFVRISETPQQVKDILNPINNLVPAEPKKYDIAKYFQKTKVLMELTTAQKRNQAIDPSGMLSIDPVQLTQADVQKAVSAYAGISDKIADTGLIFVIESCDKSSATASVYICFFNTITGKIIHMVHATGNARGFGLRNYWAGAMYQIMKDWQY